MKDQNFKNKIHEFYLVTNEFCKLLENSGEISKSVFLSSSQKILNLLYLKASLLSQPAEIEEGEAEKFVQESDWIFIKEQTSAKLGLSDKFIELTMPENYDPENFETITISECFADIYQDLRNFSTNFEIGNEDAILASIYECLDNFEKFWGIRALSVLVALHNLIYGGELSEDENIDKNENDIETNEMKNVNKLLDQRFNN